MKNLRLSKPVRHTLLWIIIYFAVGNLSDFLSGNARFKYLATGILLIGLSLALLYYIYQNKWGTYYGIKPIRKTDLCRSLYYFPLIFLAGIQFSNGINPYFQSIDILLICIVMIGVGFIEEVIFRGFLLRAIELHASLNHAIAMSGITFGMSHLVNLFNGYAIKDLIGQIIIATILGLVLALLAAVTHNLIPGILFHIQFNISGAVMDTASNNSGYIWLTILAISLLYALYLFRVLRLMAVTS